LAEAICKRILADELGCDPSELPARGYEIRSAGVAAWAGDEASPTAVEVAHEYGADLTSHRSRPVNPELLTLATRVIAMTQTQATALEFRFPGLGPRPELLCGDDGDLLDPIGGDLTVYRDCAEAIRYYLVRLLLETRTDNPLTDQPGADGA